ncbi:hypothetical protein GLOIN_2v1840444 [Rhizophagus irregularis DAOM 181602=DAOM 197198]|uniref:Uncharacterized protein n=1 Tax=Rhizophagus irregularis (strain DAOM 181602 / DAOM 197198 / MUCL 43194) TaxID=747089 RepID=A0A2P4Q4J1_RHIID|nr:hypothetical protein GLOIN_2v1840444 [Rhizophagus irregularis DAOM 181602=DAOM 197198]POG72567.1 hypothetical protein GLOIN_2v1840444 [Rhizophagus irregularis DAOM 181602=DAOM 197198]|eukprot:XP_025179433.1 hypothetical protein GLOIN_2v1840444 [Rhizophagus irregularis DAOM 181602=DAOM 197198]
MLFGLEEFFRIWIWERVYYNLNDKITSVKKWIEKKLENEYIRYFKHDEFKIDEEEIGRGRDIRILMVLSSYFGRHLAFLAKGQAFGHVKFSTVGFYISILLFQMSGPFDMFCKVLNSGIGLISTWRFETDRLFFGWDYFVLRKVSFFWTFSNYF